MRDWVLPGTSFADVCALEKRAKDIRDLLTVSQSTVAVALRTPPETRQVLEEELARIIARQKEILGGKI
jgi:hypothetical protein